MVRLLESVPGAVLLERLCPGTPVAGLTIAGKDDEATRVLAEVLHQFAPERSPPGTPSVEDWGKGFPAYLASGDSRLPRGLVERSAAWYRHLAGSQRKIRLLHGDFHHHNVLTDQKRGWVAIDPKGVLGEMEFEVGAALRNPLERLAEFSNPRAVERRVSHFARHLRLDLERTLAWAYAQAVLSAIWLIEDRLPLEQGEPTIALARRMEAMLPPPP
jgi:streptomycin 6-kinase